MTTCTVVGCEREKLARGYCSAHYSRWRSGKSMEGPVAERGHGPRPCAEEGCLNMRSKGRLCWKHRAEKRRRAAGIPPRKKSPFPRERPSSHRVGLSKEIQLAISEQRAIEMETMRLKHQRMHALLREGLPVVVICARLGLSQSLVKLHARQLGARLPTFPEWDEVNVA